MKTYKLSWRNSTVLLNFVTPILMVGTGILFVVFSLRSSLDERPPAVFTILWFGLVIVGCVQAYRLPFEITVQDDLTVRFRSVLRTIVIPAHAITAIKARSAGFADLRYQGGKVRLTLHMQGFHEFLTTLKTLNPAIEIKGC